MAEPVSGPKEVIASSSQVFHHFPFLPSEVRSKIWTLALLPHSPWQTSQSPPGTPLLHKAPFITFHRSRFGDASLADPDIYLAPRNGDEWQDDLMAERLRSETADHCDGPVTHSRVSRTQVFDPPRKWSAGWGVKEESAGVAASCEEAERIWRRLLTRRLGGLEGVADLGRDVVHSVPCRSTAYYREREGGEHERPVPTLRREDAFKVGEA